MKRFERFSEGFTDGVNDWERGALRQLYSEYRHLLDMRRIQLRPAAIELCDSESHWGRWNPETRTIELARRLLREHPWFRVIGILRHEMAHQLVDEAYGDFSHHKPHGDAFQWACQKLGVPQEYSGASVHLQTCSLDWRTEKSDDIAERMLEKVRKLLALATSVNEHEAALAMNRVREIYAKYNLEHGVRSQFVHLVITSGSKRIEAHEQRIISILVGHFFVQVISGHTYHPASGETHRMFEIVGRRENVLMAEYVYYFLLRQMEQLVAKMVSEAPRDSRGVSGRVSGRVRQKSYRLGVLQGFAEKLHAAEQSSRADAFTDQEKNVITSALVEFKKDKELDRYLGQVYPRLRLQRSTSQRIDTSAYDAGKTAGKQITLNKPVSSAARGGIIGLLRGR